MLSISKITWYLEPEDHTLKTQNHRSSTFISSSVNLPFFIQYASHCVRGTTRSGYIQKNRPYKDPSEASSRPRIISTWVAPATDLENRYSGSGADSALNRVFTPSFTLSRENGMLHANCNKKELTVTYSGICKHVSLNVPLGYNHRVKCHVLVPNNDLILN